MKGDTHMAIPIHPADHARRLVIVNELPFLAVRADCDFKCLQGN
jgi:hypothetical protein